MEFIFLLEEVANILHICLLIQVQVNKFHDDLTNGQHYKLLVQYVPYIMVVGSILSRPCYNLHVSYHNEPNYNRCII